MTGAAPSPLVDARKGWSSEKGVSEDEIVALLATLAAKALLCK